MKIGTNREKKLRRNNLSYRKKTKIENVKDSEWTHEQGKKKKENWKNKVHIN